MVHILPTSWQPAITMLRIIILLYYEACYIIRHAQLILVSSSFCPLVFFLSIHPTLLEIEVKIKKNSCIYPAMWQCYFSKLGFRKGGLLPSEHDSSSLLLRARQKQGGIRDALA